MSIKLGSNPPAMAPQLLQVKEPPAAPAAPSAPPQGPVCVPGDGFDAPSHEGPHASRAQGSAAPRSPPTIDDLKKGLLASPEFKKMSPGAHAALEKALPYVKDPRGLKALHDEMNSKWFQGLKPDEQEKTMKSLLNEVLSPMDKIEMKQRELIDNMR